MKSVITLVFKCPKDQIAIVTDTKHGYGVVLKNTNIPIDSPNSSSIKIFKIYLI